MSIVDFGAVRKNDKKTDWEFLVSSTDEQGNKKIQTMNGVRSDYHPDSDVMNRRIEIIRDFQLGDTTMRKPRPELNDLSVLTRHTVDQMSFNTYQSNNGQPIPGDEVNGWRSRAMRPIVRNKCISIAAHATAHLIFPKVFAYDDSSDEQTDAATVMSNLMEWVGDQSDFAFHNLQAILTALWSPASIIHSEYTEVYKTSKSKRGPDGKWIADFILDEEHSGFIDTMVPVDQMFIENFYEQDIQKQGFLIWRRVSSFDLLAKKYAAKYDNWKYVQPGVQLIYNDADVTFYQVYDPNMRQWMAEEVIWWNKAKDCMCIMVNGVMLTEYDNPNPRQDKQYPFTKFGYELIDEGKCFYYKSVAFKTQQDANIINELYPMIVDGTYLQIFPAMFASGGDMISSDVIVPGGVTTLTDENSKLVPIQSSTPQGLNAALSAMNTVNESLNESSEQPLSVGPRMTAYAISMIENEQNIILGLFLQMISYYVKQYGKLKIGDILQFMTIADADEIVSDKDLVYRTFLMHNKQSGSKNVTRKIQFTPDLPNEPMSEEDKLDWSYHVLNAQGGDGDKELYLVNPELFRNLKFMCAVTPDVLTPSSEDAERAYLLEEYNLAIANPLLDQEQVTKDFLLAAYPRSKNDVEKYFKKESPLGPNGIPNGAQPVQPMNPVQPNTAPQPPQPNASAGPLGTGQIQTTAAPNL